MQTSKKQNKPVTNQRRRSRNPNGQPKPYRDGNRWKAPGFVVDSQGNRYSVIGTGSTMLAAMRKLEQNKSKKLSSFSISQIPLHLLKVSDYMDDWLNRNQISRGLAYKTLTGYRAALNQWVLPRIGQLKLHELRRTHIEGIFLAVASRGKSRSTQVQIKSVLEPALRDAVSDGYLNKSPYLNIRLLPKKQSLPAYHDLKSVKAILQAAQFTSHPLRWHLAIVYGLRQSEVLGLRWSDINLDSKTPEIHIQLQLQRQTGQGLVLTKLKSFKSNRHIPLIGVTVTGLKRLREAFELSRKIHGDKWNPEGFVFATPAGKPIDHANDRKTWIKLLDVAQAGYLPLKSARATFATHLNNLGASNNLLGHAALGVTDRHYASSTLEDLQETVQSVYDRIFRQ